MQCKLHMQRRACFTISCLKQLHQTHSHCLSTLISRQPYHVHVIIPCYKDSLTNMKNTLLSALSATMPPGCTRTIFLVDDSQASRLQGASMLGLAAAEGPKALCHADRRVACGFGPSEGQLAALMCRQHLGWVCLQKEVPLRSSGMAASCAQQQSALQAQGAPEEHRDRMQCCVPQTACCALSVEAPVPAPKQTGHPRIPGKRQSCPFLSISAMQPWPDAPLFDSQGSCCRTTRSRGGVRRSRRVTPRSSTSRAGSPPRKSAAPRQGCSTSAWGRSTQIRPLHAPSASPRSSVCSRATR